MFIGVKCIRVGVLGSCDIRNLILVFFKNSKYFFLLYKEKLILLKKGNKIDFII